MWLNETEAANKYMNRSWTTQTALTLVANTEQTVAIASGKYYMTIDSEVDLKLEFNLLSNTTSITANSPVVVLGGFPETIQVPQGLVDETTDTLYAHFESTGNGDVKWVTG